jgi:hypothetical protein
MLFRYIYLFIGYLAVVVAEQNVTISTICDYLEPSTVLVSGGPGLQTGSVVAAIRSDNPNQPRFVVIWTGDGGAGSGYVSTCYIHIHTHIYIYTYIFMYAVAVQPFI